MTSPSLWRSGNFLRFWSGQGISQLGTQLGLLAMPVLAVGLLNASEFDVGLLGAAGTIAFLVVGLPAGAWVDRWRKRRVMIAADAVRAVAMLAIPVLWWSGLLHIWQLYLVALVVGVATVFFDVSYQSVIPFLVERSQVPDANSRLEGTAQVARVAGPSLGGAVLTVLSAPVLFVAESLGYTVSALCLWRVRVREDRHPVEQRRSLGVEIREGLAYVLHQPLLRRIVLTVAGANFCGNITGTLIPILLLRELNLGAVGLGIVLSVGSVGGVLGAVAVPHLARWMGEGRLIPVAAICWSVAALGVPLAAALPTVFWQMSLLIAVEFVSSFAILAFNVMQVSMRQRICPPALLGRMNASIRFMVFGVIPLGALLAGVLGTLLGAVPAIWIGALAGLLTPLAVVFSPLLRMRTLPDSSTPDSSPAGPSTADPGEAQPADQPL
ncbi:MFS transporter [Psychromicrobium xiongbiense]|uniref:MFS transporter n=1 Tax=Psychromicrobium xiongbiense TaxID=3051184 RepID=UPI0025539FA6|nr:MFS transporter [Psychromicrobium sp. YIM S02556]